MAVEVCIRPLVSVEGTRCTRCTPDSHLSLLYTAAPFTCPATQVLMQHEMPCPSTLRLLASLASDQATKTGVLRKRTVQMRSHTLGSVKEGG